MRQDLRTLAAYAMLASMNDLTPGAKCREFKSDWWMDQDGQRWSEDQLRAQLICYTCPVIKECRQISWGEPAHVWAGLTAPERYQARKTGRVPISDVENMTTRPEALEAFITGGKIRHVAAMLRMEPNVLLRRLRAELKRQRLTVEGGASWANPPALPYPMSLQNFRAGDALHHRYQIGQVAYTTSEMAEESSPSTWEI